LDNLKLEPSTSNCVKCDDTYRCPWNSTLRTIVLQPYYWRLSDLTKDVQLCAAAEDGTSPCLGGTPIASCSEGHGGPLCQVCTWVACRG
jgi:hypothetical protein